MYLPAPSVCIIAHTHKNSYRCFFLISALIPFVDSVGSKKNESVGWFRFMTTWMRTGVYAGMHIVARLGYCGGEDLESDPARINYHLRELIEKDQVRKDSEVACRVGG